MSIQITATGRATKDPEVKFLPSGQSVTNFKIAVNHRKKNQSGEWVDDSTSFLNVEMWGKKGENVAEQVKKGHMLTVTGHLKVRQYETRDGTKGTAVELNASEVARTVMPARQGQTQQQNSTAQTHEFGQDPWAQDGQAGFGDEPPF